MNIKQNLSCFNIAFNYMKGHISTEKIKILLPILICLFKKIHSLKKISYQTIIAE